MQSIGTITRRLMRTLALQSVGSRVTIIEGKSESGAHVDRSQILGRKRTGLTTDLACCTDAPEIISSSLLEKRVKL